MKVLTYGDIMDGGRSVFTSVAKLDGRCLQVSFMGMIRVDNPHKELRRYIDDLARILPDLDVDETVFDFTELIFCNSNGFYVIMDITELVYQSVGGPVKVRRLKVDDWQQETLPILLDVDAEEISKRTTFEDIAEL